MQIDTTVGPIQIASNVGYGEFGDWVDSLDAKTYGELIHLYEHGWSQDVADLIGQLDTAIKDEPPKKADVLDVATTLAEYLKGEEKAVVATITDGLGGGEESEKSFRVKENPNHDPNNGEFTSGSGAGSSLLQAPDPSDESVAGKMGLNAPTNQEEADELGGAIRKVAEDRFGPDLKNQCREVAQLLYLAYKPYAVITEGQYPGHYEEGGFHVVANVNGYFFDVTADQFGGPKVAVIPEEEVKNSVYASFRRSKITEQTAISSWGGERQSAKVGATVVNQLKEQLGPKKSAKEVAHAPAGSPIGGQFISGGGASGAASSAGHLTGSGDGKLMHLVELPVKLEHAVTHAVTHAAKAAVSYVSELAHGGPALEAAQSAPHGSVIAKVGAGANLLAKGGMKAAFASWVVGNKAVELVARAKGFIVKGLSEPEIARVKGICAGYDVLACKAVFLGLEHSGIPALQHLAAPSTFIPMASAAYLAYSTATNPIATWKAAKDAVKYVADKFRKKPKAFDPTDTKGAVAKLCDAAKKHAGDDYFFACLTEAIEDAGEHGGDISDAIELAEEAAKAKPHEQ